MTESEDIEIVKKRLGRRSIVLVGLMGCGKSSVGKRLAFKLGLPFVDADDEIERAAAKSIDEIFADHGEAQFRDGERKVIARLLRNGPQVLATGGGAYMHAETRQCVRENGISIWLRAELPVLMRRVMKRDTRPLLREGNPEATMQKLIEARYPVYAEADMTVESRDEPHDIIVAEILNRLAAPSTAQARTSQGAAPSRSVSVELGDRSYDVLIASGLLRDAGALIKARLGAVKCGVVTDENVARHHLATLEESLKAEGLFAGSIVMKPGEATKSFRDLATLSERLLELGLERGDLVVPFGGGVIGDLAGFAAGILRRGIRFVQIPTSLLAQVDSSVGGKTGINTPQGKNLIGVSSSAKSRHRGYSGADDPAAASDARRLRGSCEIRSSRRRAIFCLARSQLAGRLRKQRPGADQGHRNERGGEGGDRSARRNGDRRAGASQPRPYLRPRARSMDWLFRSPTARRRRRDWHVHGVPPVGKYWNLSAWPGRPCGKTFEGRRPSHQNRRHSGRPCRTQANC